MVFSTAAKVTADIVEDIATKLIAAVGGYWTDITVTDPGATMWTTANKTLNNAKRALKFDNGLETPLYFAFEVINQASGINYYFTPNVWYYGKGIRIVVSPSWDSIGHTYPTTGVQSSFMAFETCYNCGVTADLATMLVTHWLWVEHNGFVIIGKPEPTGDSQQQSFIIVVERADTIKKRYVDGYSNFYVYTAGNMYAPLYDGADTTSIVRHRLVLRPFAYQYPDTPTGDTNTTFLTTASNGNGISFSPVVMVSTTPTYYAYKSTGNGKVYYIKPIVHNQANSMAPIFQGEFFFPWSENVGLIDGDIVAIQGQPTKFLCKALDSPDSTNRLTFAIKYVG